MQTSIPQEPAPTWSEILQRTPGHDQDDPYRYPRDQDVDDVSDRIIIR